jgi:hypothetical protein
MHPKQTTKHVTLLILLFTSVAVFAQRATPKDREHCANILRNEKPLEIDHLSSADGSDLELCRLSETMDALRTRTSIRHPNASFWRTFRGGAIPLWFDLLDVFCEFHPSAQYIDLFDNVEQCPSDVPAIHTSRDDLDALFLHSIIVSKNFQTFRTQDIIKGYE